MKNREKRSFLIERMESLNNQGISCKGCQGDCCTFVANSMQVTKDEGKTLLSCLVVDENLIKKLETCVTRYGLNKDGLGNGRRASFIRRTYTCPFFEGRELGCSIPLEYKPYGCLAFNPLKKGCGEDCLSDQELLEKQFLHNGHGEDELEEKLPIPSMLLKLIGEK